jgi:hypothetical protein
LRTYSDQVDTSDLLKELRGNANHGTAEVLRRAICQELTHPEISTGVLNLQGILDISQF